MTTLVRRFAGLVILGLAMTGVMGCGDDSSRTTSGASSASSSTTGSSSSGGGESVSASSGSSSSSTGGGGAGGDGGAGGSGVGGAGGDGGAGGSGVGGAGGSGVGGAGGSGVGGAGGGPANLCGNGIINSGEACDDKNMAAGDCCSSACQIEAGCEVEANNTTATANDTSVVAIAGQIKGLIAPSLDRDFFSIAVPPGFTATLSARTLDGFLVATCASLLLDSQINIRDAVGVLRASDDDNGGGFCAHATAKAIEPGSYFIEVFASTTNANLLFDYVLGYTLTLYPCGDSVIDPEQQCDDGNQMNGDGCSDECRIEALPESEPNNACAEAEGPFTPTTQTLFAGGSISPVGDNDFYEIIVPVRADLKVETYDGGGPGYCDDIDTKIELFAADCSTILASDDNDGQNLCSKIDPAIAADVGATRLSPGTYYVRAHYLDDTFAIPAYMISFAFTALCGDGVAQGSEECDDIALPTATCDASCERVPMCGDMFVDGSEQCDDGNMAGDDGCSAACQLESFFVENEAAGNDTTAQADANPIQLTGDVFVKAGISAIGDKDVFRLTLAQDSVVRLETFDGTFVNCMAGMTTTMRLLNSMGTELKMDTATGILGCSALVLSLAAGTYYVQVEDFGNNGTIAAYSLEVKIQTDAGPEVEPNETQMEPVDLTSYGSDYFVLGGHQVDVDSDYYAVEITAGSSLRVEVIEGNAETCESNGVNSKITIYNAVGTQVDTDDNLGRGNCSLIDGTGLSPLDPLAHNLAAGVYYIQVTTGGVGATAQFDYRLVVTERAP